jgi:hypothetical protein
VLGFPPAAGRNFTAEEELPGAPAPVIISDQFRRDYFGAQADAIGSTIIIDGVPATVIGIMPPKFRHPFRASVWLPLQLPRRQLPAITCTAQRVCGRGSPSRKRKKRCAGCAPRSTKLRPIRQTRAPLTCRRCARAL